MSHAQTLNIDLPQLLRTKGMKVTSARLLLLNVLSQAKKPLSVQELYARVGRRAVDQVTVYRTVKHLVASGIVRQIDFQQGYALFELVLQGEHHHAICTKCDRVVDIAQVCTSEMDREALKESGFATIERHSLEFFGMCKQCSR